MDTEKLSDLTMQEFSQLVEELVDRRLQTYFKPQDERSIADILADIDRHMWTPPPDANSSLELLREDRDT